MDDLATLYKQTDNRIQMWHIHTNGARIVVTHGQEGGKVTTSTVLAKPKNAGRANETTSEEQATKEALAKWQKKVDREDYAIKPEWSNKQLRPMLALDATKVGHRVNWDDALAQPKLDGLRLVYGDRHPDKAVGRRELLTRRGDVYEIPYLNKALGDLYFAVVGVMISRKVSHPLRGLDGEVYSHGTPLNEIVSMARKPERHENGAYLEYHAFDLDIPGLPFIDRLMILSVAFSQVKHKHPVLRLVAARPMVLGQLDEFNTQYVSAGYEGTIIRHSQGLYKKGRSADLFKYKKFQDEEAKIVEVQEDLFGNAMFVVERSNGVQVGVTPKRTHAERKAILESPELYVGKLLTVKYQAETPDGSLQFPVGLAVRDYE